MTEARSETVVEGVEGVYHCTSRCVRQFFLCGLDRLTGRSYEHRRAWVKGRIRELAEVFAVDVLGYAVMSNHFHVVLRTRPDLAESWSAAEAARRWRSIFSRTPGRTVIGEDDEKELIGDPDRIAMLRERLSSLSWFMRCLNEHIARRANREDGRRGRFWAGRYKCQALLDDSAVLACLAYVDLNPVRAGLAETPEESRFTSVRDRIRARNRSGESRQSDESWLSPIGEESASGRRGVLEMTLDEYLSLLDWTGRTVRPGAVGAVPEHLAPILERLGVEPAAWGETAHRFGGLFRRAAGRVKSIRAAARRLGRKRLGGLGAARAAFVPS